MLRVSCRSFGMALTAITGMLGVNSFRRASVIVPPWISQRAPAITNIYLKLRPKSHTSQLGATYEFNCTTRLLERYVLYRVWTEFGRHLSSHNISCVTSLPFVNFLTWHHGIGKCPLDVHYRISPTVFPMLWIGTYYSARILFFTYYIIGSMWFQMQLKWFTWYGGLWLADRRAPWLAKTTVFVFDATDPPCKGHKCRLPLWPAGWTPPWTF